MSMNKKKYIISLFKTGDDKDNLEVLAHISSKFRKRFHFLLVENDEIK